MSDKTRVIILCLMLIAAITMMGHSAGKKISALEAELAEYQKANCYPPMANDAPSRTEWDKLYKVPPSLLQCKWPLPNQQNSLLSPQDHEQA